MSSSILNLSSDELRTLRRLNTPSKIQDFLETIPINFEPEGDTCLSPRRVLREKRAHCIEAAMLAALALRLQGERPLLVDLTATVEDFDHVIAVFRHRGHWGAISKSNHAVLRYRDPIYRTIRELIMSYAHEYTNNEGTKTLCSYTNPINLKRFDDDAWMTSEENVWTVPEALCDAPHFSILPPNERRTLLRPVDAFERKQGLITEWKDG